MIRKDRKIILTLRKEKLQRCDQKRSEIKTLAIFAQYNELQMEIQNSKTKLK